MIIAETERLTEILNSAERGHFTGMVSDNEALERAEALGLVVRHFEGPAALLGLSTLHLTSEGEARLASLTA